MTFPASLDALTEAITATTLEDATGFEHDLVHNATNAAVNDLEAKVGIDSSAVTTSHDYMIQHGIVPKDHALQGDISPSQLVANTNDWAPTGLSTAAVIRLSTDASRNLTGITGGADGRVLVLLNVGSFDLVLKHQVTSSSGNQFALPGATDLTLGSNQGVVLWYDSTSTKWRPAASAGSSGGSGSDGSDHDILDHADANTSPSPTDGDVLTWDSTPGEWIAMAPSGGGDLDDLGDVNAPSPADEDVLTFDSGSGEWIAAAAPGSAGAVDSTVFFPDNQPSSPGATDDEFDTGSLSGSWTDFDPGSITTNTVGDYGLKIVNTTAGKIGGVVQAIAAGDHAWVMKASLIAPANDPLVGFLITQGTGGTDDLYTFGLWQQGGGPWHMALFHWNQYDSFNSTKFAHSSAVPMTHIYLRVRRVSATWYYEWSTDGIGWVLVYSQAEASMPFTPADIGPGVYSSGTGFFRFFRELASTAQDAPLLGDFGVANPPTDLDDLGDVVITTPATNAVLKYDGADWVDGAIALDDLSDAVITSPATNALLVYNGSNWIDEVPPERVYAADTPTAVTAINSVSNVTLFTDTVDIAAGDIIEVEAWLATFNNSTAARTYTFTWTISGVTHVVTYTQNASATQWHKGFFRVMLAVDSTSFYRTFFHSLISSASVKGTPSAQSIADPGASRDNYDSGVSDQTGTGVTVKCEVLSSNATATQSAEVGAYIIRRIQSV